MSELCYEPYFEQHGDSAKPALVLLHGWGMNAEVWREHLPALSEHFHLTLIDLPGLGRSPADPEQYSSAAVIEQLLSVAPPRAIWLGWSLGGQLALALAASHPERVQALVMVASNPCFVQRDDWACAMAQETYQGFAGALAVSAEKTLTRFIMLQTQGAEAGRDTLKQLKQVLKVTPEPAALEASLRLLERDERAALANIRVPVLMQLGDKDLLVPVNVAEGCRALNPALTVQVYEGAGHLPFCSHPQQWLNDLCRFAETQV